MTQYVWRVKTRLPERYMALCKVIVRGKLNSCLVVFEDGYKVVTSRNYVMKWETMQKRILRKKDPKGFENP
jgi:hypothetical protein